MPSPHIVSLALLPRVDVLVVRNLPPLEHNAQISVVDLAGEPLEQGEIGRAAAAFPSVSEHRDVRPALSCVHQHNAALPVAHPESHERCLA
jgi:hypothetical protein